MNTKHTQGLMKTDGPCVVTEDGKRKIAITHFLETTGNEHIDNARRLVACWNALVDLPQAALDGGWTRAGLEAYGIKMKQQRDELLTVVKMFADAIPLDRDTVKTCYAVTNDMRDAAHAALIAINKGDV